MGNITYQKAFRKQLRTSYKGLNTQQKAYIKAKEKYEQCDKFLSYFYSTCPRGKDGSVNWDIIPETDIDLFEQQEKEKNKAVAKMSKLEDIIDVDYTLTLFLQSNTHSMSF